MTKKPKKLLLTAVLLAVLMISTGMALSPTAHAAEITNSQQATDILGNVVGLSMNSYTTTLTQDINPATNPVLATAATTAGLSQETLIYNLIGAQGSLRASLSFINGSLNQIYLSNYVGSPSLSTPTTNVLDMAQGFLQNYQSYTDNSFYGSLSSMLNGLTPNTNLTITQGNIKLQVNALGNTEEDLIWSYVDNNGVPALAKDVILSYSNGLLQSFLDNWQLYQISGAPAVSSQTAIAAALSAAQNFSYIAYNVNGANVTESNFNVTAIFNVSLSYVNYYQQTSEQSIRGGNPYILYPSWYVGLGFGKVYPGGVTGLNVMVWADSGNVSSVEPIVFNSQSSASSEPASSDASYVATNQAPTMLVLLSVVAVSASGVTGLFLYSTKITLKGFKRTLKLRLSKRKLAALCLAILPLGVIFIVPSVQAANLKSELYVGTYVITSIDKNEYGNASNVVGDIQALYQDIGVPVSNNYGSGTTYANIESNIESDDSNPNVMGVAVFHFGHGYLPDYIDSNDQDISYSNIASWVDGSNKNYFIWMWTCTMAGTSVGSNDYHFADAWTSESSLSSNGYGSPDSSDHCFIGFQSESPTIGEYSFYGYTQLAFGFIEDFYYYAVISDYSVHNALNQASEAFFSLPYASCPLAEGYGTYWAGGYMGSTYVPQSYDYPGIMMVYGDSNVIIY
jgi:hypothetical protein